MSYTLHSLLATHCHTTVFALSFTIERLLKKNTYTPILVPKQVNCNMCRFSKLLLFFFFFFCKDGSDRLMKRASYSCCNFLCVVLAAAYLKYRRCRLSCLPLVWHSFFIVTHTHTVRESFVTFSYFFPLLPPATVIVCSSSEFSTGF